MRAVAVSLAVLFAAAAVGGTLEHLPAVTARDIVEAPLLPFRVVDSAVPGMVPLAPVKALDGTVTGNPALGRPGGFSGVPGFAAIPVKGDGEGVDVDSVQAFARLGAGARMVDSSAPASPAVGALRAESVDPLLSFACLGAVARVTRSAVPIAAPFSAVCGQWVDPLLSPIDVWGDGLLGELRAAARAAAARGDDAEFRRLAAEYWAGLETALERRRVLAAPAGGEKAGARGTRRGGP